VGPRETGPVSISTTINLEELSMTLPLVVLAAVVSLCWLPAVSSSSAADEPHPIARQVKEQVPDPSKPFVMLVKFQAKPGQGDALVKAFGPAIAATLKEKGCQDYRLSRSVTEPESFVLYERWESLADLEAHLASDHIKALGPALEPIRAAAPTVDLFVPTRG
jgi:quinol monooxygenase YgiN